MANVTGMEAGPGAWFAVVNSGWFGALLGFVLSIIATIISYVLYRRAKITPQLRFALVDEALVNSVNAGMPGRLEFRYDGNVIPRVTGSSVGIWNAGTTTFRRDDVVAADRLRLTLPKDGVSSFLQGDVAATSREVNDVRIGRISDDTIAIDFDFLDPGDGFRLRLIHSGSPGAMKLEGTIRGLPEGLTSHIKASGQRSAVKQFMLSLIICAGLVTAATANVVSEILTMSGPGLFSFIVFLIAGFGTIVGSEYLVRRRKASKRLRGVPIAISEDDVLYSRLS